MSGLDGRFRNVAWVLPVNQQDQIAHWDAAKMAVLMDIRDELQTLNRLLGCRNFALVPTILRGIARNTKKPARKKKAV